MWDKLSGPWKACFEEAWEAYGHGSIPIGAVVVDMEHNLISRGRNRINESSAPLKQTCSNRLAHAEINALLQLDMIESDHLKGYTLYTTTEPCVLCFGAITMSGIRQVRYAATDPVAGGADLIFAENSFIKSRNMNFECEEKHIGEIQRVLRTDHVIRTLGLEQASRFLNAYKKEYPEAIQLGMKWYKEDILQEALKERVPIEVVVNKITDELRKMN